MIDKQIIIDDCIHLDEWKHCDICEKLIKTKDGANGKKREHLLTEEDLRCDFYPNCYYKQLARKEQECETLASQLDFEVQKKECLEQECEELKEKVKKYGEINEQETKDYAELKAENEELKERFSYFHHPDVEFEQERNAFINEIKKNNKLKQTLTEIKEIAEILAPMTDEYENCLDRDRCFECDFTEDCQYFNIKQILQKISKCEGNDEKR